MIKSNMISEGILVYTGSRIEHHSTSHKTCGIQEEKNKHEFVTQEKEQNEYWESIITSHKQVTMTTVVNNSVKYMYPT